ncbi:MAG: hypothetical protein IT518_13995 [Burkholderiales bacterium]|nr:hypothetical protein [Burkholderiales bacterium]
MVETASPRTPRIVPGNRAFQWFAQALRLWKQAPLTFSAMALVVIVLSIALRPVPVAGLVIVHVAVPLLICGFLYAILGADRNDRPRFAHLFAAFLAPLRAQAAVVAAAFVVSLAESVVAWQVAGVNLLVPGGDDVALSAAALILVIVVSALVTVPLAFVPMAVLFDDEPPLHAFVSSWLAFTRNPRPMLALAAYIFALTMLGFVTYGAGFVLAFPWICAAQYAAWKDIFGVGGAGV